MFFLCLLKTFIVGARRGEAVLTSTHNLCFRAKIGKKMYTPVNPNFTVYKWDVRGYESHGHVIMMAYNLADL